MVTAIVVILLILVALAIGALAMASTKPDTSRTERTMRIHAPPEAIYPHIVDFHAWPAWSPWEKKDPAMKRTFTGAPTGPGAAYAWSGNTKVGAGRMEIVDASPFSRVLIALHFLKPFKSDSNAEFTLVPQGEATTVTWAMYGPTPLVGKVMASVMDMDRMIGRDFERGLANLKALAERPHA
ncbi:MAG: K(+)-transporting ATPase subunit F [Beijerinckiaceae bacterium]